MASGTTSIRSVATAGAPTPLLGSVRTVAAPGVRQVGATPAAYTTTAVPGATRVVYGGGGVTHVVGQYSQAAYEQKQAVQEDPQLANLKDLRKNSGLKNVPVSQGLKALKAAAVDDK